MITREEIEERAGDSVLFLGSEEGEFDRAIIGLSARNGYPCVVYDVAAVVAILVSQGMTYDDAMEWYDFNIASAYMGASTPMYVETFGETESLRTVEK
jgi:hypothetical protein